MDKCIEDGGTCGLGGQCSKCPHRESNSANNGLLEELWPVFLEWVNDYVGDSDTASKAVYSREDMRYAYSAGYAKRDKELQIELKKIRDKGREIATKLKAL